MAVVHRMPELVLANNIAHGYNQDDGIATYCGRLISLTNVLLVNLRQTTVKMTIGSG
jgi:hypothetical protein